MGKARMTKAKEEPSVYEIFMSTLQYPEQRTQFEWVVGSIIDSDVKDMQKIFAHCLDVYRVLGPHYYDDYIPSN